MKLYGGIEAINGGVNPLKRLGIGQIKFPEAIVSAPFSPTSGGFLSRREQVRTVNEKQRLPVNSNVSGIIQILRDMFDEIQIILSRVILGD